MLLFTVSGDINLMNLYMLFSGREPEGKAMLSRIRSLINDVIIEEDSSASLLSDDDVLQLIGEFPPTSCNLHLPYSH